MKKRTRFRIAAVIFSTLVGVIYYVGVYSNPSFDIHEFCMGLFTEIIGLVIALTIVDQYIDAKIKWRGEKQALKEGTKADENQSN